MAARSPASLAVMAMLPPLLLLVLAAKVPSTYAVECPSGYTNISSHCFNINFTSPATWASAKSSCTSSGGYLAIFDDCYVLGDVVAHILAQGYKSYDFWVGASDEAEEGLWIWVNGDFVRMGMPFWGQVSGIPQPAGGTSQNCLFLYSYNRHQFDDGSCTSSIRYICQADPVTAAEEEILDTIK